MTKEKTLKLKKGDAVQVNIFGSLYEGKVYKVIENTNLNSLGLSPTVFIEYYLTKNKEVSTMGYFGCSDIRPRKKVANNGKKL